jgi:uncharacterized protein (PEP-CTERM system associated)
MVAMANKQCHPFLKTIVLFRSAILLGFGYGEISYAWAVDPAESEEGPSVFYAQNVVTPAAVGGNVDQSAVGIGAGGSASEGNARPKSAWTIQPRIRLLETYTDNVNLESSANKKSDLITDISPGISLSRAGSRFKLQAKYSLQNLFYVREHDKNALNHQLDADARAELRKNLLFLDAKANISQTNDSLLGAIGADNATGRQKTTLTGYQLSPYLRRTFDGNAVGELRYTLSQVNSDNNSSLSNSVGNKFDLRVDSGPAFNELGWAANYSNERISYKNLPDTDLEMLTGTLKYRLTPRLRLLGTAGYEKNSFLTAGGDKPEGSLWNVGFAWNPTHRTSLEATAGRRFFGDTYHLAFNHTTRRTVWNVNYDRGITTTRSQFLIPSSVSTRDFLDRIVGTKDPTLTDAQRSAIVDQFLARFGGLPDRLNDSVNFLTNQTFLEKKFLASLALTLSKSVILFDVFDTVRDAESIGSANSLLLGQGDFALSQNIRQSGGDISWDWHFGVRTDATASLRYSKNDFRDTGRTDRLSIFRLGVNRKMTPHTTGGLEFRHVIHDSTQIDQEYDENAIIARLIATF